MLVFDDDDDDDDDGGNQNCDGDDGDGGDDGGDGQDDIFRTALYPYSQDYQGHYNSINDDGVIPDKVVYPDWGPLTDSEINAMSTLYGTDSSGALQAAATAFDLENAFHLERNGENDPLKFMIFMSDGANNASYECTSGGCVYGYYFDERSISACNYMKASGVTVYTIGYHLVAGYNNGYYIYQSEVDRAQELLADCATDSSKYILAQNASELNAALVAIGQEVMVEVIRIKR